jgi:hypothetical protein
LYAPTASINAAQTLRRKVTMVMFPIIGAAIQCGQFIYGQAGFFLTTLREPLVKFRLHLVTIRS